MTPLKAQLVSRHSLRVAFGLMAIVGGILGSYLLLLYFTSLCECPAGGGQCACFAPWWAGSGGFGSLCLMAVGIIGFGHYKAQEGQVDAYDAKEVVRPTISLQIRLGQIGGKAPLSYLHG